MYKTIFQAKRIIKQQVRSNMIDIPNSFSNYQKGYLFTNENINGYLNIANIKEHSSALTVTSSGDHAFNLVGQGILDIDTFDINYLSEYIALGLKRAMILKYNYYEFLAITLKFMNNISLEELTDIINDLLPYMERKHRIFWTKILNYNYKLQKRSKNPLNLILLLCCGIPSPMIHIYNNAYLLDEYCYQQLRRNLGNANITFTQTDAIMLPEVFKGKEYDLILLSNILDYFSQHWDEEWSYNRLEEYLASLEGVAKEEAIIFIKYIFDYKIRGIEATKCFRGSNVSRSDITDEFTIIFDNVYTEYENAMIFRRVRKQEIDK